MHLPVDASLPPMEAEPVAAVPNGPGWQYEPKWDGFRCLAFRDGAEVVLRSKAGQPLGRYFPDVVAALAALAVERFVLDGELVVPVDGGLSFDQLQLRLHPAATRVGLLAARYPALYLVFDLLVDAAGRALLDWPLHERRRRLAAFAAALPAEGATRLSPASIDQAQARAWLDRGGADLDGIIAKQLDQPYHAGERRGMVKFKEIRTADCVVGGFRYAGGGTVVGSLLLGLYDDAGLLHHVGFTSGLKAAERAALTPLLEGLVAPPGFTGRAPGGPSRWSRGRVAEWRPLAPRLVVEVGYDHVSGGRFRHGTTLRRWRPDKRPDQCGLGQLDRATGSALRLFWQAAGAPP